MHTSVGKTLCFVCCDRLGLFKDKITSQILFIMPPSTFQIKPWNCFGNLDDCCFRLYWKQIKKVVGHFLHSILDSLGWCDLDLGQGKRVFKKGEQHMQQHSQVGSLRGCRPKIRVQALSLKWLYCSNPSSFSKHKHLSKQADAFANIFFSSSSLRGNIIINVCLAPTKVFHSHRQTPREDTMGDAGRFSATLYI